MTLRIDLLPVPHLVKHNQDHQQDNEYLNLRGIRLAAIFRMIPAGDLLQRNDPRAHL